MSSYQSRADQKEGRAGTAAANATTRSKGDRVLFVIRHGWHFDGGIAISPIGALSLDSGARHCVTIRQLGPGFGSWRSMATTTPSYSRYDNANHRPRRGSVRDGFLRLYLRWRPVRPNFSDLSDLLSAHSTVSRSEAVSRESSEHSIV